MREKVKVMDSILQGAAKHVCIRMYYIHAFTCTYFSIHMYTGDEKNVFQSGRVAAEGFSPTSPRTHWSGPELCG